MPLYEFACAECGQEFEELVFTSSAVDQVVCPHCGSARVSKKISTFASRIAGGGDSASLSSSAGASCSTGST